MLMAMDIGPGDEVIVPPYTMHATVSMVLQCGATPVFADIEDYTFCLDPEAVKGAISPRTKGILVVNLFGHPARLDELKAIADAHGLFLLEDNAQSPAGMDQGQYTGTIGQAGVFSLNRHKTIQSGEGGVVITNDDRIALKMRLVRNHGEAVVKDFGIEDIVNTMGQNLRMPEMEAAVACCQLGKLDRLNEHRIRMADRYTTLLKDIPGISPPAVRSGCKHVYYFYVMKYDEKVTGLSRAAFVKAVNAEGYFLRAGYLRPLYMEPMFQQKICFGANGYPFTANPRNHEISYAQGLCPVCERLQEKEILITNMIYPPLDESYADGFVMAVRKVLNYAKDIAMVLEKVE
jgi:dTDP-4-amino-4,6-dideoxygalactose transaminase